MSKLLDLGKTFNTVSEEYDTWRPDYVEELYNDLFSYKTINKDKKVLEIGIGTGQATEPFLKSGCRLTAVELGRNLTDFSKKKFGEYDNFEIINSSFEDIDLRENSFDMIYSATAFHWIPEEIGYTKVFNLLKNGGVFVRFANRPYKDKENEELDKSIRKVYSKYMTGSVMRPEFDEEQCKRIANIASKYGFEDITHKVYKRTRTFTPEGYTSLLGTYSDVISLENEIRIKFLDEIRDVISKKGGKITVYDTIDLQLARKIK